MKTCKRLGIKTVAIYSEADANAVSLPSKCFFLTPMSLFVGLIKLHNTNKLKSSYIRV